jgi:hypothetical protein
VLLRHRHYRMVRSSDPSQRVSTERLTRKRTMIGGVGISLPRRRFLAFRCVCCIIPHRTRNYGKGGSRRCVVPQPPCAKRELERDTCLVLFIQNKTKQNTIQLTGVILPPKRVFCGADQRLNRRSLDFVLLPTGPVIKCFTKPSAKSCPTTHPRCFL